MHAGRGEIEPRRKWLVAGFGYLVFCLLYLFLERHPARPPLEIPELGFDRAVPFLAWTVWIYLSQWVLLPIAVHRVKSVAGAHRFGRATFVACALSFTAFELLPTTVPRVGLDLSGISGAALAAVHGVDPPLNCFPSLHVSLALVAGLALRGERPGAAPWALPWVCLIALSTITTRQHLLIDVAGGAAVAYVAWRAAVAAEIRVDRDA